MKRSSLLVVAASTMLAVMLVASLPSAFADVSSTPSVRITPRTINLKSHGKTVEATIEMGASLNASDVVPTSVAITAINGVTATVDATSVATSTDSPSALVADFSRSDLQALLPAGTDTLTVSWSMADGTTMSASDTVRVINPGGGKGHDKAKGHGNAHGNAHGQSNAKGHSKAHGQGNAKGHGKGSK